MKRFVHFFAVFLASFALVTLGAPSSTQATSIPAVSPTATSRDDGRAFAIAMGNNHFHAHFIGFRSSGLFNEVRVVFDNGDGTTTVQCWFYPRSGVGPTQLVGAMVDIDNRLVLSVSVS